MPLTVPPRLTPAPSPVGEVAVRRAYDRPRGVVTRRWFVERASARSAARAIAARSVTSA